MAEVDRDLLEQGALHGHSSVWENLIALRATGKDTFLYPGLP